MSSQRLARVALLLSVGSTGLMMAGCGAPVAVAGASYAANGTLLAASNRASSDHLMSMVSKKDCALWRAFTAPSRGKRTRHKLGRCGL